MDWHEADAREWGDAEQKWASVVGVIAGESLGTLLLLIFAQMPDALTLIVGGAFWLNIGMAAWAGFEADWCRQWREYHSALAANPVAWPWPRMPGDVA